MLAERTPVGDKAIPGGTKAVAGEATDRTITAGHTLCGSTESRTKAKTAGSETKCLDLGGNVGLIDKRVSTRRDPRYRKADRRQLTKAIAASLAQDRRRRAE